MIFEINFVFYGIHLYTNSNVILKTESDINFYRSRSQGKIIKLYETHEIFGIPPVCWVQVLIFKKSKKWQGFINKCAFVQARKGFNNKPLEPTKANERRMMRWGSGFNRKVVDDVVDDTKGIVIFDTPCERKDIVKVYILTTTPQN